MQRKYFIIGVGAGVVVPGLAIGVDFMLLQLQKVIT